MANKAKRHIHKYYRAKLAFGDVWACALDNCNHYMPQHMEGLIPGKASLCWNCNQKFILDPNALNMELPTCVNCRTGIDVDEINAISDAMKERLTK